MNTLNKINVIKMPNFQAKSLPSAARIPVFTTESGIAPSKTPCGHRYLQKKGSPMPRSLTANAGRIITVRSNTAYLRKVKGRRFLVDSFFPGS